MLNADLTAFLDAPAATVAAVAPATVVYAAAGTRRQARLDGVPPDQYAQWALQALADQVPLFFQLGVRHLVVPALGPDQLTDGLTYGEASYGAQIAAWIAEAATGATMQQAMRTHGFRTRLIGPSTRNIPVLREAAAALCAQTAPSEQPVLWFYVLGRHDEPWQEVLTAAQQLQTTDRAALVEALYGEPIPPAAMLVGFGRLVVGPRILPPLLFDADLHCFWTQRTGYRLTERMLRRMIYDVAVVRDTTTTRATRYNYVEELRDVWEQTSIIGLGTNRHGFWLPEPYPQEEAL